MTKHVFIALLLLLLVAGPVSGVIRTGSVHASKITANSITANEIAANTITADEIAANAITTSELAADSVTSAKIAAGTIVASDIQSGSISADRLNVSTLSAITANLGTVTAGSIVVGSTNRLWLNDGGDGVLAVGGSTKASAPFFIQANGTSTIDSLTSDTFFTQNGEIFDLLSSNSQRFSNFAGGGSRNLCVDNAGNVFAAASC